MSTMKTDIREVPKMAGFTDEWNGTMLIERNRHPSHNEIPGANTLPKHGIWSGRTKDCSGGGLTDRSPDAAPPAGETIVLVGRAGRPQAPPHVDVAGEGLRGLEQFEDTNPRNGQFRSKDSRFGGRLRTRWPANGHSLEVSLTRRKAL